MDESRWADLQCLWSLENDDVIQTWLPEQVGDLPCHQITGYVCQRLKQLKPL